MKTFTWIGKRPKLVCTAFKKELPQLQVWQSAIRIKFNFETVWCVRQSEALLLNGGELIQIAVVHNRYGSLIGSSDPYQVGLDYSLAAMSFRGALNDRSFPPKVVLA